MLFWILVAVLTAVSAVVLLHPLLRGGTVLSAQRAGEAAVYRDQLQEVERDRASGLISADEAEYARAEIGRRLLAVSARGEDAAKPEGRPWRRRIAEVLVVALVPAIGLSLYLKIGSPDMPDQPLAARLAEPGNDMAILIAKVEAHLAGNPNDGKGWDLLAPIYFRTMRLDDAEAAYRNAIRLLGPSPERLSGLAETLLTDADGIVTEDARLAFEKAVALDGNNPRAKFYLALAMEQAGDRARAKVAFEELAAASPAGAPWLPLVNEHIARNGGTPVAAAEAPKAPGNPSAEDVAAAEAMSGGDRQQMIEGMVESLDARLKDDPNNFEGWTRLIRSYVVLDRREQAEEALRRGLAAFPASGKEGQQLVALGRELGLSGEGAQE
ncbi:c-type cytochrome biogenesis protein CcmI [Rhizobiaceae bacterium n13]|uniref:C-type cytochrome biogenesis protein CcmI n=1 Tax=Ferirhizobium litorale TaxID=2927786 RepID=A0AAE3QDK0_9HYPH|nr:c-type cytochrome biogenesis protein CcmI [Fererhizobium litorale]MDI7861249.1 c-type cytochrome biogenesis protein CcmI [Fererhizobium litorale]MDI7921396.1 c-type cytochrome biogenesis protein CcmI [Fererhizobium litorale]